MTELKPCPFCGCKDIRKLTTVIECDIFCISCGASMNRTNFVVGSALADTLVDAEPKAIEAWNRRTPEIIKVETNFYDKEETFENCTVQVLTNTKTGDVSVGWWENDS